MLRTYELVSGTVLFLVGLLGFLFREEFGNIPTYLLAINLVLGLVGLFVGLQNSQQNYHQSPPQDTEGRIE